MSRELDQRFPGLTILSRRPYLSVFAVALAIRIIYAAALFIAGGEAFWMTHQGDSPMYLRHADEMLKFGGFLTAGPGGMAVPLTERMPLYIALLAGLKALTGGSLCGIILLQAILDAASCVAIARIASRCDAALPAGFAAAINPTQIVVGALVLSDTVFFFLCCLTMLAFVRYLETPTIRRLALAGLAAGAAVLTREVMLYGALAASFILPSALAWRGKITKASACLHVPLALVFLILPFSPILARNLSLYHSFQLTSQKGSHLTGWVLSRAWETAGLAVSHSDGAGRAERLLEEDPVFGPALANAADPFAVSAVKARFAARELGRLPVSALVRAWATGAAITLATPSLLHVPPFAMLPHGGFADTRAGSVTEKVRSFLSGGGAAYRRGLLAAGALLALWRFVQIMGFVAWLRSGRGKALLALGVLWGLYILVLNGPVASPKYRLPMEVVLNIATAWGWAWMREKLARFT